MTIADSILIMDRRITTDVRILAGKPVIKGTRIPVYLILDLLAHGYTPERVINAYPKLTKSDIRAALNYGQALARNEMEFVTPKVIMA